MILGIDAREIQNGTITGIGRSLANFIDYFIGYDKKNQLVLFSERKIEKNLGQNIKNVIICPKNSIFYWDQWQLARELKTQKIDLFYSPYYKVPIKTNVPVVSQILDLMFLCFTFYKNKLGIIEKLYYTTLGKAFAKKSICIITDSEHAKKDIIRTWKIDHNKIKVIPLGLASRYKPVNNLKLLKEVKNHFKLPDKFLLYLGNFKPHKNVTALIRAFKRIENIYSDYKLVLAGPLDDYGIKVKDFVFSESLENRIQFTNTIKEEDYPEALLSLADIFVFPSLYEGFGLPPLEAMACGTPVIASNLTAVPEVIGDAGLLVNPLDVDEISKAIIDLIENHEKREFYVKKGLERSDRFKEKDTAGKLYNHIISLLEKQK